MFKFIDKIIKSLIAKLKQLLGYIRNIEHHNRYHYYKNSISNNSIVALSDGTRVIESSWKQISTLENFTLFLKESDFDLNGSILRVDDSNYENRNIWNISYDQIEGLNVITSIQRL